MKIKDSTECYCKKMHHVAHELAQSLFTIHTYVAGFIVRINKNNIDLTEFSEILKKINHQVEVMGTIIHSIDNRENLIT